MTDTVLIEVPLSMDQANQNFIHHMCLAMAFFEGIDNELVRSTLVERGNTDERYIEIINFMDRLQRIYDHWEKSNDNP